MIRTKSLMLAVTSAATRRSVPSSATVGCWTCPTSRATISRRRIAFTAASAQSAPLGTGNRGNGPYLQRPRRK